MYRLLVNDYCRLWTSTIAELSHVRCQPLGEGQEGKEGPVSSLSRRNIAQALFHTGFVITPVEPFIIIHLSTVYHLIRIMYVK